ncbi:hypothetical protein [Nitrospirillum iridis]|uniref:DUF4402 domain-containing protein n=1 Tax=Nitrospirillum iridis TaxID=765888 RepID=A0A7X0AW71_9PROT|nr:hypothetical protein [Nitrospirillum iridis]MBB6251228.1 hypothetical protein [Nitrospirillum iridis]
MNLFRILVTCAVLALPATALADITRVGRVNVNVSPASGSVITVLAPANNVGGAIIRNANMNVAGGQIVLIVSPTTPTGIKDGTILLMAASANTSTDGTAVLPREAYVPPGYGIYGLASTSVSVNSTIWVNFDVQQ